MAYPQPGRDHDRPHPHPYPGTKFHARLLAEGRITDFDTRHYNTSRAVFRPALMSAVELEDGYRRIYKEFYSLKCIARRLPEARSQWAAYLLFNLGYRKLGPVVAALGRLGMMGAIGRPGRALSYPVKSGSIPAGGRENVLTSSKCGLSRSAAKANLTTKIFLLLLIVIFTVSAFLFAFRFPFF
ncbi:MAG: DUF4070 domain-containing protein [Chromatiales bacterium]|nr:DUF4070 domain-containing protein [Chromatiales bacterium]